MNDEASLSLSLTVNEINGILAALGKLPFEQVTDLIKKIHSQAMGQLQPAAEGSVADAAE
jgi:hypothetical protein